MKKKEKCLVCGKGAEFSHSVCLTKATQRILDMYASRLESLPDVREVRECYRDIEVAGYKLGGVLDSLESIEEVIGGK